MHERIRVCSILALDDETYGIRSIEPSVDTKFVTVGTPRDVVCIALLFDGFERSKSDFVRGQHGMHHEGPGDPFVTRSLD
jgi:hypothetical protein